MISVHHIGARSGSHPFPFNEKFNDEIFYVMYDADESCIDQIKEEFEQSKVKCKVIYSGVGEKKETRCLNINYDPNTSSFLNVNKNYSEYYYSTAAGYDYIVDDSYSVVKECAVNTKTLDELCSEYNITFPDVLSMDTQGTELEILKGASNALKNTVAVLTEVAFIPIYKDQPLFKDIDEYLIKHGFIFCRFYAEHADMSPYRAPIGARGKGLMVAADAIYLKSPEYICNGDETNEEKNRMLLKLSYVALSYGMLEYSLKCIKLAKINTGSFDRDNKIFSFMNTLYHEVEKYSLYPKKFSDVFSVNDSMGRFDSKKNIIKTSKFKLIIKKSFVYVLVRRYRRFIEGIKSFTLNLKYIIAMKLYKNTSIENLLIDNGMPELAVDIKSNRLNA